MLFKKFRLTFVCKYKYYNETSNVFLKKRVDLSNFFFSSLRRKKNPSPGRGIQRFLRLSTKY